MNVILIGMKHCGKSSDGKALADFWHCPFIDTDDLIEQRYARENREPLTVRAIYARHGETFFRELETRVVASLHGEIARASQPHVIAVGGGTVLNEKVKPLLREMGKIVYLEMSVDQLFARVERNGLPPFLRQEDPSAHFAELYRARVPHYQELADVTVRVDGMDVAAALDAIRRSLDQHAARGPHQTARP